MVVKSRLRRSLVLSRREASILLEALCLSNAEDPTTTTLLLRVADLYYQMQGVDTSVAPRTRNFLAQHGSECEQSEEEPQAFCFVSATERRTLAHQQPAELMCEKCM